VNAPIHLARLQPETVEIQLDGRSVTAFEGETILTAAKREGIAIPHLCFKEGYRPDGNCRACVVEIAGERTLAPSCCRAVAPKMDVKTGSERARKSQKMVLEMLLADLPEHGYKWVDAEGKLPHGELSAWAQQAGV
jgi:formate dehydrogenase major subunit